MPVLSTAGGTPYRRAPSPNALFPAAAKLLIVNCDEDFSDQPWLAGYLNLETRSACSRMTLALSVAAVRIGSLLYMIPGFEK